MPKVQQCDSRSGRHDEKLRLFLLRICLSHISLSFFRDVAKKKYVDHNHKNESSSNRARYINRTTAKGRLTMDEPADTKGLPLNLHGC